MRIALILPKRRLGSWHERLAQALAQQHAVTLFLDDRAPAYPRTLRAWLATERLIYRTRQAPSGAFSARLASAPQTLDHSAFDAVVDLSEHSAPRPGAIALAYDGSPDSLALVDRLLGRQTPHLSAIRVDTKEVLAQSLPAIDDRARLTRGLQLCFGRAIALVERALRTQRAEFVVEPPRKPEARHRLPAYIGRFLVTKAAAVLSNRLLAADRWHIAMREGSSSFVPVRDDGRRSFADPFLFGLGGRTFVFVEECSRATGKGVISAAEVFGDRLAAAPVPVLERPYHLSYPVVFEDDGAIYMLPETAANKAVELYRAVGFPWRWELDSVLIEGKALADATPLFHRDRWWLFAAAAEHGTTDRDELFVFYSDALKGPWLPHAQNPVKSDCRSARPAGRIVSRDGRLFRPAQDCERRYGAGIVWHEIVELDPMRYSEHEVVRFDAAQVPGLRGLHTINQSGPLQVIDIDVGRGFWRRRAGEAMARLGRELDLAFSPSLPHWRDPAGNHCAASRHKATSRVA